MAQQKNVAKKSFAKGVMSEWKKIIWPTPKEVLNYAIVVVVVCLIVILLVFGLDSVFHFLYKLISK
ncbi:MAG: preprotein translocase subunit SecE [Miniphocaeibacter sp.]|jgi:preprotein translocase subunit SecE|uniref:preprotein translocase subunit SecE n=1 Tax=Miniphocaeibacter sp. TaxID=3100973 RepID=UPI0018386D87|nr:preprotein translocase subunit SecE [Gallicola sp.]